MIHSGVLLSVTPFQPGPTSFSSVSLWHEAHFNSYTPFPAAIIFWSSGCVNSTCWNFPTPVFSLPVAEPEPVSVFVVALLSLVEVVPSLDFCDPELHDRKIMVLAQPAVSKNLSFMIRRFR